MSEQKQANQTTQAEDSVAENSLQISHNGQKEELTDSRAVDQKIKFKRPFPWALTFIALLIFVLVGANYWQYQHGLVLKQSQHLMFQQLSDASNNIAHLDSQLNETSNLHKSLAQRTQLNEQGQQALQATLEQMSQQLKELAISKGKEPLFWKVSEVEYLLSVANHRLILEKDVGTARTALQDADKRLIAIGDPGLISVRKKLTSEIDSLKLVSQPDIPGMASQLSNLADMIDNLPFIKSQPSLSDGGEPLVPDETEGSFNFVLRVLKDIARGLFTIQRTDQPIEPLLPPQEKQYLKHNLGLKIEEARIALLNQETASFQKNLGAIDQWARKYFDDQDPTAANFLQTIADLKQADLQPELPDISGSLREIKTWMDQQKQASVNIPAFIASHSTVALSAAKEYKLGGQ